MDTLKRDRILNELNLKPSNAKMSIGKVVGHHIARVPTHVGERAAEYIWDEATKEPGALSWFDHTDIYWHAPSMTHVLLTQPYDLWDKDYQSLVDLCHRLGVSCCRSKSLSWWVYGWTELVAVHRNIMEIHRYFEEN